jgi:hypothetical protein
MAIRAHRVDARDTLKCTGTFADAEDPNKYRIDIRSSAEHMAGTLAIAIQAQKEVIVTNIPNDRTDVHIRAKVWTPARSYRRTGEAAL